MMITQYNVFVKEQYNAIKKAELIFQLYFIWIMDLILKLVKIVLIVALHQL